MKVWSRMFAVYVQWVSVQQVDWNVISTVIGNIMFYFTSEDVMAPQLDADDDDNDDGDDEFSIFVL